MEQAESLGGEQNAVQGRSDASGWIWVPGREAWIEAGEEFLATENTEDTDGVAAVRMRRDGLEPE